MSDKISSKLDCKVLSSSSPQVTSPTSIWDESRAKDKNATRKRAVAFFQKKWKAVKRLFPQRNNKVGNIHLVQDEDEPLPGPSDLPVAHSGPDTGEADPSPSDPPKEGKHKNFWKAVKKAFSRRANRKVDTQPDEPQLEPINPEEVYSKLRDRRDPIEPPKLVIPVPRPVCNDGFFPLHLENPRLIWMDSTMCLAHQTDKSSGQKVTIKEIKYKPTDRYVTIPGSDEPLHAELAVNVLLSQPPCSKIITQLREWYCVSTGIIMSLDPMETMMPCSPLGRTIRANNICLSETVARVYFNQIVRGQQECLDRGVFYPCFNLDDFLVNPNTLELKFENFRSADIFEAVDIDMSQYIGKAPPVEYKKRIRYQAEKSTVWYLGRFLYKMLLGREPYINEFGRVEKKLSFRYFVPFEQKKEKDCRPMICKIQRGCVDLIRSCLDPNESKRPTLRQILDHKWLQAITEPKPHCPVPDFKHAPDPIWDFDKNTIINMRWRRIEGSLTLLECKRRFEGRIHGRSLISEIGANILIGDAQRCHQILRLDIALQTIWGHNLIFEDPGPLITFKEFLKVYRHLLREKIIRQFWVQAAIAVKECLDVGIYHRPITSANFLFAKTTRKLLLCNFHKGEHVDTSFNTNLHKENIHMGKRLKHLKEKASVFTLGRLLYSMVQSRGQERGELTLSRECQDLIGRCLNPDVMARATLQEALEHEWFRVSLPAQ